MAKCHLFRPGTQAAYCGVQIFVDYRGFQDIRGTDDKAKFARIINSKDPTFAACQKCAKSAALQAAIGGQHE